MFWVFISLGASRRRLSRVGFIAGSRRRMLLRLAPLALRANTFTPYPHVVARGCCVIVTQVTMVGTRHTYVYVHF
jgi:hypothetical protein